MSQCRPTNRLRKTRLCHCSRSNTYLIVPAYTGKLAELSISHGNDLLVDERTGMYRYFYMENIRQIRCSIPIAEQIVVEFICLNCMYVGILHTNFSPTREIKTGTTNVTVPLKCADRFSHLKPYKTKSISLFTAPLYLGLRLLS